MQEQRVNAPMSAEAALATDLAPRVSTVHKLTRTAIRKPLGTLSLVIIVALWLVAALAPLLAPYQADQVFVGPRLAGPSLDHWFGTDELGRDVFSRVVYGSRLSLTISVAATVLGILGGTIVGVISGYFLGVFDLLWQRVVDAFQAMPVLVVLMVIVSVLGANLFWVAVSLIIITVPVGSRVIRSATIAIRQNSYIEAAQVLGAGHARIMLRHVLPNVAAPIIVLAAIGLGSNILLQAALSFLGLVSSQTPDWGGMLNLGARRYMEVQPWLAIAPGLAISLAVLSYNLLGDALRDILDPRLRGSQ